MLLELRERGLELFEAGLLVDCDETAVGVARTGVTIGLSIFSALMTGVIVGSVAVFCVVLLSGKGVVASGAFSLLFFEAWSLAM